MWLQTSPIRRLPLCRARRTWRLQRTQVHLPLRGNVLIGILCLSVIGCNPPPPPPPPPAPQPVPAPPEPEAPSISEQEVGTCLGPFFYVLFDRGFRPSTVGSPGRYPVAFIDGSIQGAPSQSLTPALQKSIEDALATTPPLQHVIAEQLRGSSIAIGDAVVAWNQTLRTKATATDEFISSRDARRFVLGMYVAQALADADAHNFHRAHVLLSDVSRVLGGDSDFGAPDQFADFRRFFTEVPDVPRYESFAKRLESYIRVREESLLVSGEDAAVLHVVGLKDAANFMRDKLSSRFTLVILPLIETAIVRGQGYGFSPPPQLVEMRRRLEGHAETLKSEQRRGGMEPYRAEAAAVKSGEDYLRQLEAFEKAVRDDARPAAEGGSIEKAVRTLQASPRSVVEWMREKVLCEKHCPLYMVKPTSDQVVVEVGHPVVYTAKDESFGMMNLAAISADHENKSLGQAISTWCSGEPLPQSISDGAAHFLLAWYWLELERPQLARMALLAGAEHLLDFAKAADIERLRADPGRNAAVIASALQAEVNAYRMLLAASAITATPAGAPVDSGESYLAELQVLMTAWRQAWLKCGLPEAVANEVVRRIDAEGRRVASVEAMPQRERYHFFDYRFEHGAVPDVVVKLACEQELFSADGKVRGGGAGMSGFVRSFDLPKEFSKASRVRWGTD
jgi:hypothetical protein